MRVYKRKTDRGTVPLEVLQKAANAVMKNGYKLRNAAREFQVCHTTLYRFVRKIKAGETPTAGYKSRVVFKPAEEALMTSHIIRCGSIFHGLLPEEVRRLAYECALRFKSENIPATWRQTGMSGKDWFANFYKKNPSLLVRKREATIAGSPKYISKVNQFFEYLSEVFMKHEFTPSRIWNLDEVGVQTLLRVNKKVGAKDTKEKGTNVSVEHGALVTIELAANASGDTISPMFVFPGLKFKYSLIQDGPSESIGACNSSGLMTSTEFLIYMDHFIKYTKPTPSEPVILLLDGHSSHINIDVVEKARENSIILVAFPAHCTRQLQPLEVGVKGFFEACCAEAQDNWLRDNPGKKMKINDIPGIVNCAWPLAVTPTNICNAFQETGIWPFNPNLFVNKEFAPTMVVDEPEREESKFHFMDFINEPGPSGIRQSGFSPISDEATSAKPIQEMDQEDPQDFLFVCCENNPNSQSKEKWIECLICKNLAHLKCVEIEKSVTFQCSKCEPD